MTQFPSPTKTHLEALDSWLESVEEYTYRRGYRRILGSLFGLIVVILGAGAIFGQSVVNTIAAAIVVLAILFLGLTAIAGTRRLRRRETELTTELQKYGKAVEKLSAESELVFRKQIDNIDISKKGHAKWSRKFTLGASTESIPHYLRAGFVSESEMTDRQKRRVQWKVIRKGPNSIGSGVGVFGTASWGRSIHGKPMLIVHAYLGQSIAEGETVTVHIDWPHAASELRRGLKPEQFYLSFVERVHPSTYSILLRKCQKSPSVEPYLSTKYKFSQKGNGYLITFKSNDPAIGDEIGVTLSF